MQSLAERLEVNTTVRSNEELLTAVKAVCSDPEFEREAAAADRENRQSARNVDRLRELGIVRAILPAPVGGGDMGAGQIARMMEIIASHDSGTATVVNMNTNSLIYLSMAPPFPGLTAALADARDNGAMFCGGASAPTDVLDTKKAGFQFTDKGSYYLVNGRGGFATGSETSKYFFLMGRNADPAKAEAVVAVTPLGVEGLINRRNWDAMGLRATGSHDMVAQDMKVPKDHAFAVPIAEMARMSEQTPKEFKHVRGRPHTGIMGCQLGSAQRAFRLICEHLEKRVGTIAVPVDGADQNLKEHAKTAWARHRLGRMAAMIDNARTLVYAFADDLEAHGLQGAATQYTFARTLVATKVMLEEVTTGITALTGAHGFVSGSPLSLALRDAVGFNAMVWRLDELMEMCGRAAVGEAIVVPGLGGT